jgi:prepilin-type N-terminal cleavage/methylation domain-containing protein
MTGVTLVELLLAIAIAAVLAMIAIPSYSSYIDRSKVTQAEGDLVQIEVAMTENYDARAIAKAIINLGHTLHKSVVAEGVETAEQLVLLRRWRCNRIQGYYFSRPLTADEFAELLRRRDQVTQPPQVLDAAVEPIAGAAASMS